MTKATPCGSRSRYQRSRLGTERTDWRTGKGGDVLDQMRCGLRRATVALDFAVGTTPRLPQRGFQECFIAWTCGGACTASALSLASLAKSTMIRATKN